MQDRIRLWFFITSLQTQWSAILKVEKRVMFRLKKNGAFLTIAILFLLLGLGYSYYTPLWNPPDEERHFSYCEYVAHYHKLPDYSEFPEGNIVLLACHPPLYYLIASLFFWNDSGLLEELISINDAPGFNIINHPQNNTDVLYAKKARIAYILRFFSLILSGVTLWCIYRTALIIFPGDIFFSCICILFVSTIPEFLHISAAVSNDSLTIALSSAYILSILSSINNPKKTALWVLSGIVLGLCLLSKTFTFMFLPITICFICFWYLRKKQNPTQPLLVIIGVAAVVSGWWYFRNWLNFNDPMLTKTVIEKNLWFSPKVPISIDYWELVLIKTFTSYFGHFGAMQFTISHLHFAVYGGILLLGIIGTCLMLIKKNVLSYQVQALWFFFFLILGDVFIYLYLNIKFRGFFMGRYSYLIITPSTIILWGGLQSLFSYRYRKPFFIVLALILVMMNIYALFAIVKPAYAKTFLKKVVDQSEFYYPSPEINADTNISQSFTCPYNNLCAIRIMVSCKDQPRDVELKFVLKEARSGAEELYRIPLPFKDISDFNRYCFIFPPIKNSMGKQYTFYFHSSSKRPNKGIALWYAVNDSYYDGSMQINDALFNGDLYFQVYCFTGLRPETDWQGRRAIAINQGPYVPIREFQLYYEQSKDFRKKTETYAKLIRAEKAFNYRKTLTNKND